LPSEPKHGSFLLRAARPQSQWFPLMMTVVRTTRLTLVYRPSLLKTL
jgi:hypothetical protein